MGHPDWPGPVTERNAEMTSIYEVWKNGRKVATFTIGSDATQYAAVIKGEAFKVTWERLHLPKV